MRRTIALALISLAAPASNAMAEDEILPTSIEYTSVPDQPEWIANGSTLYTLTVSIDASSDDRHVGAFQWTLTFDDSLTLASAMWPPDHFFSPPDYTIDPNLSGPDVESSDTSVSGRVLIYEWPGPVMEQGPIATYFFTVDPGTPPGQYQFGFTQTLIGLDDPDFNMCEPALGVCTGTAGSVVNQPFTIVAPPCAGDVNGDGTTDVFDFGELAANFNQSVPPYTGGDLDGTGFVDVFDFGILAADFGCGG